MTTHPPATPSFLPAPLTPHAPPPPLHHKSTLLGQAGVSVPSALFCAGRWLNIFLGLMEAFGVMTFTYTEAIKKSQRSVFFCRQPLICYGLLGSSLAHFVGADLIGPQRISNSVGNLSYSRSYKSNLHFNRVLEAVLQSPVIIKAWPPLVVSHERWSRVMFFGMLLIQKFIISNFSLKQPFKKHYRIREKKTDKIMGNFGVNSGSRF